MIALEDDAGHVAQPFDHRRSEFERRAPLLAAERGDHVLAFADAEIVAPKVAEFLGNDLETKIDAHDAAEPGGRALDEIDFLLGVDVDAHAEPGRAFDIIVGLAAAVEDDLVGIGAAHESRVQLAFAEAVAAGALLVQDRADGEIVVRLDGIEDFHGRRPCLGEGLAYAPEVRSQRVLGNHIERRAMRLQKIARSYAFDQQFSVGRHRQPVGRCRDACERIRRRAINVRVSLNCFVWHRSGPSWRHAVTRVAKL